MTSPTPTPGIEPTIRRIAEEVSREYLGNILGLCLSKQKAPQEPAPVEESEAVRKAREEERAKVNAEWQTGSGYQSPEAILEMHGRAVDRAVHQARVDALGQSQLRARHQGWLGGLQWACANSAGETHRKLSAEVDRLEMEFDRLEREQAKTAGAKEGENGDSDGDNDRKLDAGGSAGRLAGPSPVTPDEAKGAPEQARFVKDDDGYWIETRDESEPATVFVPLDVVERRVAETGSAARIQAALSTRHVAARRVVAERDAAEAKAKANYDEGMKHYLRAEAAEARVRELENAAKQIRANAYAERYGELTGHKQRADTAESELARVRAELAEVHSAWDRARGALVSSFGLDVAVKP